MGLKQELPLQRRDSSDCLTLGVSGGEVTQLNGLTILISAATGLSFLCHRQSARHRVHSERHNRIIPKALVGIACARQETM
jgi:hypothetical protein